MKANDYVVLAYVPELLDLSWASKYTKDEQYNTLDKEVHQYIWYLQWMMFSDELEELPW